MSGASATRLEALVEEAQRVLSICNACRYCEGYCAVFPALQRRLEFRADDVHYLANLCHNCGACLDACQYAPPHEFAVNFPRLMAEVRPQTYRVHAWPAFLGAAFERNGAVIAILLALCLGGFLAGTMAYASPGHFWSAWSVGQGSFYALLPHGVMAGLFGAVFLFVMVSLAMSGWAFWSALGESPAAFASPGPLSAATSDAAVLRYLDGGGEGCRSEGEAPSNARRNWHHVTAYGFLLCFASTVVATILHYGFAIRAPYPVASLPVLLGIAGGIGIVAGPLGLLALRERRDPARGDPAQAGMDAGFLALLVVVGISGLALLGVRETRAMGIVLALHLGAVFAFFLAMPYGKFVHGLYRFVALVRFHVERRRPVPEVAGE